MLSYQHHYHAGNHADVLKHWLLIECVKYLQKKDNPFDYIDTHAGAGLYQLNSTLAKKTAEYEGGVLKIDWAAHPGLSEYHALVEDSLKSHCYLGSPAILNKLLRAGDQAWLFELHPQTIVELEKHCASKRKSFVEQADGFAGLLRLLPNKSRRALVLIDPSYEIKSDYQRVVQVIEKAYNKMPQTVMLLWYPVVERQQVEQLERKVKNSSLRNVQLFEMGVGEDEQKGMQASGMIVVNPPWTLADTFNSVVPELSKSLSEDGVGRCRCVELVAE